MGPTIPGVGFMVYDVQCRVMVSHSSDKLSWRLAGWLGLSLAKTRKLGTMFEAPMKKGNVRRQLFVKIIIQMSFLNKRHV